MGCCRKQKVDPNKEDPEQEVKTIFDKRRSCTDVICLAVFGAFLVGMYYVLTIGLLLGSPNELLWGVDSWGNICNQDNDDIDDAIFSGMDLNGFEHIYYYDVLAIASDHIDSIKVCVKECPEVTITTEEEIFDLSENDDIHLCRYDITRSIYFGMSADQRQPSDNMSLVCPTPPLTPRFSLFQRCIPTAFLIAGETLYETVDGFANQYIEDRCGRTGSVLEHIAIDLYNSYDYILILIGSSVIVSLLMIQLLRFFTGIIVWTLFLSMIVCTVFGCFYTWTQYGRFRDELNEIPSDERIDEDKEYVRNWLIVAIIMTFATAIVLLVLLVMRKRIALVVQLFKEAAKCVAVMPMLCFQPIWTVFVLGWVLGWQAYGFLYIFTADEPEVQNETGIVEFETSDTLFYMKWYYFFGILWSAQFIFACQVMIIAGSVVAWYFTRDKEKFGCRKPNSPMVTSLKRLVFCHLGSVALGSCLIAIVQLARAILMYIQAQLRGRGDVQWAKYALKCCGCCLWCLEKVIKFLTKNAYIMICIYGCNLLTGGARAVSTLLSNILRVGAVNSVGAFVLFMAKIGVVVLVVVSGLQLFTGRHDICYVEVPLLVAGVGAFIVADTFLDVFGMAIDTLFLCFCVDSDKNDGVDKPYYMSKDLMRFVDNASEAVRLAHEREQKAKAKNKVAPAADVKKEAPAADKSEASV